MVPFLVARGEQPQSSDLDCLRKVGIGAVLSLREEQERADPEKRAYSAQAEAAACAVVGLSFRHIPLEDKVVPDPEIIAAAVEAIDEDLLAGRPVFVHCLAGIGRTGLVAAAWGMARGGHELKDVGELFFAFLTEMYSHNGIPKEHFEAQHRKYRVPAHWWAIRTIAASLGLFTGIVDPFPAESPPNAQDWTDRCHAAFQVWHRSTSGSERSRGPTLW